MLVLILPVHGSPPLRNNSSLNDSPTIHTGMKISNTTLMSWNTKYRELQNPAKPARVARRISYGTVTSVKDLLSQFPVNATERNQGTCGNCWVWASTGVMEISLASQVHSSIPLSVQYFDSNYNNGGKGAFGDNWSCTGGMPLFFSGFYALTTEAVPWSNTNAGWGYECVSGQ
ncbi:MAG: C1 family peptidase [Methanoregula sp.]|uniref:C1 family peptidase n=1 Tax=Methanoregula sp. TaxID=2052170 RepID=UPI003D0C6581